MYYAKHNLISLYEIIFCFFFIFSSVLTVRTVHSMTSLVQDGKVAIEFLSLLKEQKAESCWKEGRRKEKYRKEEKREVDSLVRGKLFVDGKGKGHASETGRRMRPVMRKVCKKSRLVSVFSFSARVFSYLLAWKLNAKTCSGSAGS